MCWSTNETFNQASLTYENWENCRQKKGGHIYGKNEGGHNYGNDCTLYSLQCALYQGCQLNSRSNFQHDAPDVRMQNKHPLKYFCAVE